MNTSLNAFFAVFMIMGVMSLSGCAGTGGGRALKSYTAESFPINAAGGMIEDMAERLQCSYPPGQTIVYLTGKDDFALSLEDRLRSLGFTIVPEAGNGVLSIGWTVDQLEPGVWYLLVKLSDGYRFSRVYADNGQTVTADGGLSQGKF